jgi:CheY-like chemotaxis protein
VAEDEDFNYLLFQQLLGELDINLIRALNGEEAVNICRSNPDINLVLMDVKMPIMDGYEATKAIKSFRPELPIIMQTAYARESDKIRAISIGCDAYLSKPIDIDEFLKVLKKFLDFSPVAQSN